MGRPKKELVADVKLVVRVDREQAAFLEARARKQFSSSAAVVRQAIAALMRADEAAGRRAS